MAEVVPEKLKKKKTDLNHINHLLITWQRKEVDLVYLLLD